MSRNKTSSWFIFLFTWYIYCRRTNLHKQNVPRVRNSSKLYIYTHFANEAWKNIFREESFANYIYSHFRKFCKHKLLQIKSKLSFKNTGSFQNQDVFVLINENTWKILKTFRILDQNSRKPRNYLLAKGTSHKIWFLQNDWKKEFFKRFV